MKIKLENIGYVLFGLALLLGGQTAAAAGNGVKYRIAWDTADSRYHVFFQAESTPAPNQSFNSAQVTLRMPHKVGGLPITPTSGSIQSLAGTTWTVGMDARAKDPDGTCSLNVCQTENPQYDYLSFVLDIRNMAAFAFNAGQELEAFSFTATEGCRQGGEVMPDADPFNIPNNSLGANVGNFFINRGWVIDPSNPMWTSTENHYLGSYGAAVTCTVSPEPEPEPEPEPNTDTDTDGDGLTDKEEAALGTNPNNVDSDGDGSTDAHEKAAGTNPLDPNNKPATPPAVQTVAVPSLQVWGQLALALLLGGFGVWRFNHKGQ